MTTVNDVQEPDTVESMTPAAEDPELGHRKKLKSGNASTGEKAGVLNRETARGTISSSSELPDILALV